MCHLLSSVSNILNFYRSFTIPLYGFEIHELVDSNILLNLHFVARKLICKLSQVNYFNDLEYSVRFQEISIS